MEPVSEEACIEAPSERSKTPDRVTLGKEEVARLDEWLKQINSDTKGFLALTRADLVSFLIRAHSSELSSREMNRLRTDNYDPLKHIAWITPQIRAALSSGDVQRVADLQEEIRKIQLSDSKSNVESKPNPIRKGRAKPKKLRRDGTESPAHAADRISDAL
jgi:hypothetical protein